MGSGTRRGIVAASVAALAVLALASAAFACTVYKGRFVVTGNNGTTTEVVGNAIGMGYCFTPGPGRAEISRGGTFSASVSKYQGSQSTTKCSAQLNPDTYDVNYSTTGGTGDCMTGSPESVKIGSMVVDSSGSGSGTYTLPSTALVSDGAICVSDATAGEGNQAPVKIV